MYQTETQYLLSLLKKASREEILPRFKQVKPELKLNLDNFKDYVTEADTSASKYILDRIRDNFPGSYSEEHKSADRFDYDLIWQLDPVDGTQEFIDGYEVGFGCHAALLQKQTGGNYLPVAGIIYLPMKEEAWYFDGERVHHEVSDTIATIPDYKDSKQKIRGFQRKVDENDALDEVYRSIAGSLQKPFSVELLGGAACAFTSLLNNEINLFAFNCDIPKDWDVAMAIPIIQALGGWITDFDGHEFINLNQPDDAGGDPYLRKGIVSSIVFPKEQILPMLNTSQLILKAPALP